MSYMPLYVSPDLGTGQDRDNDGLAQEYIDRRSAGWGTGLLAYWPGSPLWNDQWQILAERYPLGFPLIMSPKETVGAYSFLHDMPKAWRRKVITCYYQEPEDNFDNDFERLEFRKARNEMGRIAHQWGASNGVHLQEWSLDPLNTQLWGGERNLLRFVTGTNAPIDVVSWSMYTGWNGSGWKQRINRIRDFMREHLPGTPWVIGAAGLPVHTGEPIPSENRSLRARYVKNAASWTRDQGGSGFGWFDVNNYRGNGQDNYAGHDPELTKALQYVSRLQLP